MSISPAGWSLHRRLRTGASIVVAFRSAKGRSFAERKTTFRRYKFGFRLESQFASPRSAANFINPGWPCVALLAELNGVLEAARNLRLAGLRLIGIGLSWLLRLLRLRPCQDLGQFAL